ncbi:hypothetical protein [Candidatus Viridilinea mediisalina]|uniref:Uncharacterized protein n=1 Tax=Candidatus Viridilinea mediisalina TaxID=2024553 RepID=A0A2A6RFE6_9CHLR|nr:hypothetical protein [Candidatus Viridilinea mediisalina]PDW01606.1 hypothetical protein CJ255_18285 [Candidatus Viridilinea mediisalina]
MESHAQLIPRAFAALEPFPALRADVGPALSRQAAQVGAALARYQERPLIFAALEAALAEPRGGLIVLEGPPGSGVTSLIAALATRLAMPLWLATNSGPAGLAALYAQLAALYRPNAPMLDPAAASDPAALEQLLADAAMSQGRQRQVLLAIDEFNPVGQPLHPGPVPLPAELPRGVTMLFGSAPGAMLPYPPIARIILPDADLELESLQSQILTKLGCPGAWHAALQQAAAGNLLYLYLASAMLQADQIALDALPPGLEALLHAWWHQLPPNEQQLAALLAAAAEPLPLTLAAQLIDADPGSAIATWEQLGLVDMTMQAAPPAEGDTAPSPPVLLGAFAHPVCAALLARFAYAEIATAHRSLADAALAQAEAERGPRQHSGFAPRATAVSGYLRRQLARHETLAPGEPRAAGLARLIDRDWLRNHERHDALSAALEAARWELRATATGDDPLRLARAVALTGMLTSRARTLTPEAAAEALTVGLSHGGRDHALKRVQTMIERLPDGPAKAAVLKRVGEVCYGANMRSSAMRLLSRALDLEASPLSRAWRDSREALHATLASAALTCADVDSALRITERIEHLERRAMVETEAVRYLLQTGDHLRAQRLARAILHETMGAWARAEVGVALVRAGDALGTMLLEEIELETVVAWAQIELACDEAAHNEAGALQRIADLPNQNQRDRGLAKLAHAFVHAGNEGAALAAAEAIVAVEVRIAALIELRLGLEGLVAMLALERATSDIDAVTGEDRAPLVADLAAALAALGRIERALTLIESLNEGEERDRARARMAVALAQSGKHEAAEEILRYIDDDDERDWAYDEFARQLAAAQHWDEAAIMCERISGEEQRARASGDLAMAQARAGDAVPALAHALALGVPAERARALNVIGPALVAAGDAARAVAVAAANSEALNNAETRARYLAAIGGALAEAGQTEAAATVIASIRRPSDRARAGATLASVLAPQHPELARSTLGATLREAAVGREASLRALERAAPALGLIGGSQLLDAISATVDALDRW